MNDTAKPTSAGWHKLITQLFPHNLRKRVMCSPPTNRCYWVSTMASEKSERRAASKIDRTERRERGPEPIAAKGLVKQPSDQHLATRAALIAQNCYRNDSAL